MPKLPSKTFTTTLLGTGPNQRAPFCDLPFDSEALFGTKGRVPVQVTVSGVTLQMALPPKGKRETHQLIFNREHAKAAGIEVGQTVRLTVALDTAPRSVEVPEPLAKVLEKNTSARKAWEVLAPSHQKEHATAIAAAKRPETLAARLEKTLALLQGQGRARPAPSAKPLSKRLHLKPDQKVVLLDAPKAFELDVPAGRRLSRDADVILLFAKDSGALNAWLPKLQPAMTSATLWIAYPKRSSGVPTDLTRDVGWAEIEAAGLGPIQQVAVDETWSALRFKPRV